MHIDVLYRILCRQSSHLHYFTRLVVLFLGASLLTDSSHPSKVEWDLTNGPLSKLLELLDTQV